MKFISSQNKVFINPNDKKTGYNVKTIILSSYILFKNINYLVISSNNLIIWKIPFWLVLEFSGIELNNEPYFINLNYDLFNTNVIPVCDNNIWELESFEKINFELDVFFCDLKLPFRKVINQFEEFYIFRNGNMKFFPTFVPVKLYVYTFSNRIERIKIDIILRMKEVDIFNYVEFGNPINRIHHNEHIFYNRKSLIKSGKEHEIKYDLSINKTVHNIFHDIFPNEIIEMILSNLKTYYYIPFEFQKDKFKNNIDFINVRIFIENNIKGSNLYFQYYNILKYIEGNLYFDNN